MLLIEKAVKLMDDFHFDIFREYVKNISKRSYYPLALIDVISRDISVEQSSEELYFKTYGEDNPDEKAMKKFFQLAHYTFKLTGYLSKNYPNYLKHNITLIQHAINTGDPDHANLILDLTIDLAQKIEDHDTELTLLSILIQREELQESAMYTKKWHERINELLEQKKAINYVLERFHLHFTGKSKPKEGIDLTPHLDFFKSYYASQSLTVNLISRFCSCFIRYFVKDESFFDPDTLKELISLETDLERSPQLILPFPFSMNDRIALLKLFYFRYEGIDPEKILEEAKKIAEESEDILYWNSFVSMPQKVSLVVQTSHYLSHHYLSYRNDFKDIIDDRVIKEIDQLKKAFKKLLDDPELEERFTLSYINFSYMYAGLLILKKESIKEGIQILNNLLLSFQQVPFHAIIDSIYAIMMMGHFALGDFEKVTDSYNRYKKATKGKAVNPENDLAINGLYYMSKWLETKRAQYVKKLDKVIEASGKPNLKSTEMLLTDASKYFKVPISLEK